MEISIGQIKITNEAAHDPDLLKAIPEEILEVILDQLKDTEDITNVFTVYPHLNKIFFGHLWSWLIASTMPLLFPKYLNIQDIKNCRVVSTRWKNAICAVLKTHPNQLPYKSERLTRMTEAHFNYHVLPEVPVNLSKFISHQLYRNKLCAKYNPFPGRFVYINVKIDSADDNEFRAFRGSTYVSPPAKVDLNQAIPIFEEFGHHIWFLSLEIASIQPLSSEQMTKELLQPLFKCLTHLPNLISLKFLKFSLHLENNICSEKMEGVRNFIMTSPLPFRLESLNIFQQGDMNTRFFDNFLKAFANEWIKKLVFYSHNWNSEYAPLFPNLRDLRVKMTGWIYPNPDKTSLQNILHDLRHSPIRKVQIHARGMYIGDILESLAPYNIEDVVILGDIKEHRKTEQVLKSSFRRLGKSIKSVISPGTSYSHEENLEPEIGASFILPSVVTLSLKLQKNCVWFEVLNLLPSLKDLTVEIIQGGWTLSHVSEWKRYMNSTNGFFKSLENFYSHENHHPENWKTIWNQMPKLYMLTLVKNENNFQYVRECASTVFTTANYGCHSFSRELI